VKKISAGGVHVEDDIHAAIKRWCEEDKRTMPFLVNLLIKDALITSGRIGIGGRPVLNSFDLLQRVRASLPDA
jgi:hypothetical protein